MSESLDKELKAVLALIRTASPEADIHISNTDADEWEVTAFTNSGRIAMVNKSASTAVDDLIAELQEMNK